ncbi:MAG: MoaD/ThiS family protein [Candidatus Hodarchaeales archaeon]|jgi:molybdopterin converting factor small subunit
MIKRHTEILFHASFREITKKRKIIEEISEDCTFERILTRLVNKYGNDFNNVLDPHTGKISNDILVMLNGKGIRDIDEKIKDKDVLIFSLPVGGG